MEPDAPLAIITGGTSGIGLATARRLASRFRLALVYARDDARAAAVEAELGNRARCFRADVASDAAVEAAIAEVLDHFAVRGAAVLVNSAGVGRVMQFFVQSRSLETAQELMNINYFGTLRVVQQVLPGMYARKAGAIVNVSSIAAAGGYRGYIGYAESKAAVECFTRNLAAEVAHRGVTVNCVAPALVETRQGEAFVAQARPRSINQPLSRLLRADEVARVIEFLIDAGAGINGEIIRIDGANSLLKHQLEILQPGAE